MHTVDIWNLHNITRKIILRKVVVLGPIAQVLQVLGIDLNTQLYWNPFIVRSSQSYSHVQELERKNDVLTG